jgi:hypothetical protein
VALAIALVRFCWLFVSCRPRAAARHSPCRTLRPASPPDEGHRTRRAVWLNAAESTLPRGSCSGCTRYCGRMTVQDVSGWSSTVPGCSKGDRKPAGVRSIQVGPAPLSNGSDIPSSCRCFGDPPRINPVARWRPTSRSPMFGTPGHTPRRRETVTLRGCMSARWRWINPSSGDSCGQRSLGRRDRPYLYCCSRPRSPGCR